MEALDSNPDIQALTIYITVDANAVGIHAAGMTNTMHHTAHNGASPSFGVAGSSAPMSVNHHMGMSMPQATFMGGHGTQPVPMGMLGYGMPANQVKGYISGHGGGGKKKCDKPKPEDCDPKPPKVLTFHVAGRVDRKKSKIPGSESYKVRPNPTPNPNPNKLTLNPSLILPPTRLRLKRGTR